MNSFKNDHYAVFGNPIEQSKSPLIHQLFAEQTGQDISYQKILGEIDSFPANLSEFFNNDFAKGCNVTAPFKQEAAKWVAELTPNAQAAGAVNTIIRMENGLYKGDTTDGAGLVIDLKNQQASLLNARILLIGAGGATRGVVLPLLAQGVECIDIVNRTKSKAEELSQWFANDKIHGLGFDEVNINSKTYSIIINCTSASLDNRIPDISDAVLSASEFAYDMVYLAEPTVFMQKAKALGVLKISDGLGMLVGQAAYSFYLWRGVMPDIQPVLQKLRAEL
ncbi:shikimate dehydrogenase [Aliiglaciecola sp. LCG003]|uniref:shikimate dehydrogenase n=1 Tax=Aliiglaciecola sp. LCG003 TaxID=3053655 RepID=UPI002573FB23|nr:shikimate dehydrogenase [Aliiglaciecola sp. LCG003]WJG09483.1 shikimate dehydrogenase [Aliiglaciecola sp. LCG003]